MAGGKYIRGQSATTLQGRMKDGVFNVSSTSASGNTACVCVPLHEYYFKKIQLPEMSKKELEDAVRIQTQYAPDSPKHKTAHKVYDVKGGKLVFVSINSADIQGRPKCVIPDTAAFFSLMDKAGLAGGNCLLIYHDDVCAYTVCVKNGRIGLMRNVSPDAVADELYLSMQDIYSSTDGAYVECDRIVLVSDNHDIKNKIQEKTDIKIQTHFPSSLITGNTDRRPSWDEIAAAGVSVCDLKKVSEWNTGRGRPDTLKSIKRGLVYSLPLWIVFAYLMQSADINKIKREIDATQGKARALAPKYRDVAALEADVTLMESFFEGAGHGLENTVKFKETIYDFANLLPSSISLRQISGRAGGEIVVLGEADGYRSVTDFLQKLSESDNTDDIKLLYSRRGNTGRVDFQFSFLSGGADEAE